MATINTIEDLIRILDENPEWTEALRSRLLTRELLELPARFAEYAETNEKRMVANDRRFESINLQFESIGRRFESIDRRFESIDRQFETVNAHLKSLALRIDRLDRRMGRFEGDMALFRSRHVSEMVREQTRRLAREVGYRRVRTLTADDLYDMVDEADTDGISLSALRSFRFADLIMEAENTDSGDPGYIAVEISYTVNGRDTERAFRNADFLRRFTGKDAVAVIAGVRKDERVNSDIEAGNVIWYPVEVEDLATE